MRTPKNLKIIIIFGAAFFLLGSVLLYTFQSEQSLGNNSTTMSLVHHTVWLIVLLGSMLVHFRANFGKAIKYLTLWIGIGSTLFIGYSLKDSFIDFGAKLKAELIPYSGREIKNKIEFKSQRGGHFVVEALVDGVKIKFLIDTGASDVVLKSGDAIRLGLNPEQLSFDKIYHTANGIVRGAPVKLGQIKIGPIEITNVRASVNGGEMNTSLLGMSFLSLIGGYEVIGDKLTLKK
jgi:aspartyl protease family protein